MSKQSMDCGGSLGAAAFRRMSNSSACATNLNQRPYTIQFLKIRSSKGLCGGLQHVLQLLWERSSGGVGRQERRCCGRIPSGRLHKVAPPHQHARAPGLLLLGHIWCGLPPSTCPHFRVPIIALSHSAQTGTLRWKWRAKGTFCLAFAHRVYLFKPIRAQFHVSH